MCILHVSFQFVLICTCKLCFILNCAGKQQSHDVIDVVDAAVTEIPGEKTVGSLTEEETTHTVSVFAIFKKVPLGKVSPVSPV